MKNLPPPKRDAEPPIIYVPASEQQKTQARSFLQSCIMPLRIAFIAFAILVAGLFFLRDRLFPTLATGDGQNAAALTAIAANNQKIQALETEAAKEKETIIALQTKAAQLETRFRSANEQGAAIYRCALLFVA